MLAFGLAVGLASCRRGPPAPEITGSVLVLDEGWSERPWLGSDPGAPARRALDLRTRVPLDATHLGGGSALVLEGLWWRATVEVNGRALDAVTGGIPPAEVVVGPWLVEGENDLSVRIEAPSGQSRALLGGGLASANFAWDRADLRAPPRLVVRPDARVEDLALVMSGGEVRPRARVEGAPAGSSVRFSAALDGAVLADLGEATVASGLALAPPSPWALPRWDARAGALLHAIAELRGPGGDVLHRTSVRTAVREAVPGANGPVLDGRPLRMMALRLTILARPDPLEERLRRAAPSRFNAVEVHGEHIPSRWLDLADELGVPVVLLPRCIGRCEPVGLPSDALHSAMRDQDERLVRMALAHPSVVMWMTEGNAPGGAGGAPAPLWTEALTADPHGRPVVGRDYRGRMLGLDPGEDPCAAGRCRGIWITEVTRRGPKGPEQWRAMAAGFSAAIEAGAVGGTIPAPNPNAEEGWAEAFAGAAEALSLAPIGSGRRRASARIAVEGLDPHGVVWLSAAGAAPVGAVADAQGRAELELWHEGPATLRSGGGQMGVDLRPARWDSFEREGVTQVVRWRGGAG